MKDRRFKQGVTILLLLLTIVLPILHLKGYSAPSKEPHFKISAATPEVVELAEVQRGWTGVEAIDPGSTTTAEEPIIVADTAGNLHLTWADGGIKYRCWNATTQCWGAIEIPSLEHSGPSMSPSIAVDGAENVHLVWWDTTNYNGAGPDRDIFYKCRNATTHLWSSTVVVSNVSSDLSTDPEIVVDISDNVHIVWRDLWNYSGCGTDYDLLYRAWNATSGTWTGTEVVTMESNEGSFMPSIIADSAGALHVAWQELNDSRDCIHYKYFNTSTDIWSPVEVVSGESLEDSRLPKLSINNKGIIFVIWRENSALGGSGADMDVFYKICNTSTGAWTTTEVLSVESSDISTEPAVTADEEGNFHVVWRENRGSEDIDIFYKFLNITTGNWTAWELVSTESSGCASKPTIAVDSVGYVHVAYEDRTDYNGTGIDMDIYYKRTLDLPTAPTLAPILPNPNENGIIILNWNAVPAAGHYYLYRNTSPIDNITGLIPLKTALTNSCMDLIATSGNYSYVVVAGNAAGNSTPSNCVEVTVALPLAAPTLEPIEPNPDSDGTIHLNWSCIPNAAVYYLYRALTPIGAVAGLSPFDATAATNYTDAGLVDGTYHYAIVAGDAYVNSSPSNCENVTVTLPGREIPGFSLPFVLSNFLGIIVLCRRKWKHAPL
jgi:hypothetical protein